MDKLELDARVARLERRINNLTAAAALAGAMLAFVLFFALARRADVSAASPATIATPALVPSPPLAPTEAVIKAATETAEGSMAALHHQLTTFQDLRDQGLISEPEWQTKKARLLSGPLTPSDIRSDLERAQQLAESHAICEGERDVLRARLLGIEE